jgi:hypothetical protein
MHGIVDDVTWNCQDRLSGSALVTPRLKAIIATISRISLKTRVLLAWSFASTGCSGDINLPCYAGVLPVFVFPIDVRMGVGDSLEMKARVNPNYDCAIGGRFDWRAAPSGIIVVRKLTDTTAMITGIQPGEASVAATSIGYGVGGVVRVIVE